MCTLFCLVDIKKHSFLPSCVFWFTDEKARLYPNDHYLKLSSVGVNDVHHDAIVQEFAEQLPGPLLGLHEDEHRGLNPLKMTRRWAPGAQSPENDNKVSAGGYIPWNNKVSTGGSIPWKWQGEYWGLHSLKMTTRWVLGAPSPENDNKVSTGGYIPWK